MKNILFFFLLPIIVFAQRPSLHDVIFYGGAGDQSASGVTLKNNNIYIAGADAATLTGQSLVMSYSLPISSGSSPAWTIRWPNQSNTNSDEQFAGVTATDEGIYLPGWSYSQTTDNVGGKEHKAVVVKFPFGGGTGGGVAGCSWFGHPNFFSYTGYEDFHASTAAVENGKTYLYIAGVAEPGWGSGAYIIAKYDTLGILLKSATDTTVGVKFSGGTMPSGGGPSYGFSITFLNGTVFAAGLSAWAIEGDKDSVKPTIWKYDPNLIFQQRFKGNNSGVYYAITNDGSSLYAVGYANNSTNKEDFLIVKFDTNGNILWRRTYGRNNSDILKAVITSGSRIFAAGSTKSVGVGGADAILMELNPANGDTLYTITYGGLQDDIANGLSINGTDLYLVGESKSFANKGNVVGQNDVMILRWEISSPAWQMQIQASITSAVDNENYLGVSNSATDTLDALLDIPEPPTSPGNYISLFFPHAEWNSLTGNNFAKDIKKNTALADTVKRWYFQVKSNVVNDTVALTFVNDKIPSALGKYLTDSKTGKRINLKNTSIYKYFNTSDIARSFMLIIGDSTAPQLTLTSPNGSNIWRSGTSKNILWSTSDGTGIDSIFVYSSSNGGTSYSLLQSLSYVQSRNWTIPSEYLNHNYSIKLVSRDSLGNQSSTKSAKTFTVVGDSLAMSSVAGWSLISTPLTPNDSSVVNMFGNTSYLWSYTQATGYTQPSKIALGNGYWLGVTATKNWFVKGVANEADSSAQTLQPGYNIIGNNFVRNVSKSNLYFMKSASYYNFSSAVSAGLISNTMYGYSSSAYSSVDTMSLFSGYWLGVIQSGVQLIEKPGASVVTPLAKQAQIFAMNWELPIQVTTASLADNIAVIGIKPTSTNQFDALYDAPRPPRNPGSNYLELYFTNSGGNYPAILGSKYARDFRDSASAQWNFTVEGSAIGDVTLGWDKTLLEGLSGTLNLKLTDVASGQTLDMKTVPTYTFTYAAPRQFVINAKITGVGKGHEILPTDYTLSQNFPNPFNPSTTIRYSLPNRSNAKVAITNTLGQEVAVLTNGEQEASYYEVTWHANGASGIYFYRIEAVDITNPNNRFVQVKKMLLLK